MRIHATAGAGSRIVFTDPDTSPDRHNIPTSIDNEAAAAKPWNGLAKILLAYFSACDSSHGRSTASRP